MCIDYDDKAADIVEKSDDYIKELSRIADNLDKIVDILWKEYLTNKKGRK